MGPSTLGIEVNAAAAYATAVWIVRGVNTCVPEPVMPLVAFLPEWDGWVRCLYDSGDGRGWVGGSSRNDVWRVEQPKCRWLFGFRCSEARYQRRGNMEVAGVASEPFTSARRNPQSVFLVVERTGVVLKLSNAGDD